jgi:hypothetical protein
MQLLVQRREDWHETALARRRRGCARHAARLHGVSHVDDDPARRPVPAVIEHLDERGRRLRRRARCESIRTELFTRGKVANMVFVVRNESIVEEPWHPAGGANERARLNS